MAPESGLGIDLAEMTTQSVPPRRIKIFLKHCLSTSFNQCLGDDACCLQRAPANLMDIRAEWQLGKTYLTSKEETIDRPCGTRETISYRQNVAQPNAQSLQNVCARSKRLKLRLSDG